ncbi:MAG: GTPase Era [Gammaproteobacteria bacterium]|nr:GTPase Era [Gammaproteobacteria bacterium]
MKNKCGLVAIVGRPNVGKSTLLNKILDFKLSITSRKAQTTRHKILGIKTEKNIQAVYVDTPGLHSGRRKKLHRIINRAALSALEDVDIVVFVVDFYRWSEDDARVLSAISKFSRPVILALNKTDQLKDKKKLLPTMQDLSSKYQFAALVPISAKNGRGVDDLEKEISELLPEKDFYFDEDQLTDRNDRFLVSEIIREKLMRLLGKEVPYEVTVEVELFKEDEKIVHIAAVIYVERSGQKVIIIGKKGEKLKLIGSSARKDIEKLLGKKVYLQLWVKVKTGWTDDERMLKDLGYSE